MNTKIKLSVFAVFVVLFGLFAVATPASAMTCNSATIYSTTSTYTYPISAYFVYGTDYNTVANGGGTSTSTQTIEPGSTIQQLISGLLGNTTYYYKLIVSGQNTDTNNFTTPSCQTTQTNPPTVTLNANPSNVSYDGSSTLTWNSSNATSCTASGGNWYGTQDTSGDFPTGSLTNTTTYNITCTGSTGLSANASATVYVENNIVNNQIPTVNIYANPSSVGYDGSSLITWNSYNASYCSISGGTNGYNGSQSLSGSFNTGALTYTTTYNIVCTSSSGQQANSSATVYVENQPIYTPPQPIVYQPQPIVYQPIATPSTLTAVTTDATQVLDNSAQLNSLIGTSANSPTNAWFEWGTTIDLGNKTTSTAVGSLPSVIHTDTLTGLTRGTTYYFRAVAENSTLRSVGSILNFTTGGEQPIFVYHRPITHSTSLVLITSSVNRTQAMVPTLDNTRPHPGDDINYTVSYQNVGNASITNLILQVVLPTEVDYISSSPVNPNILGNNLTFSLGTLRGNGNGTVTIQTRVQDSVAPGTELNFPATLSYIDPSGQPQSVNANVSAQVWIQINGSSFGAFVFGAGFFPTNLFGWLLLLILILLLVLLAKYLYNKSDQPFSKKTTTTVDHQPLGKKTTTTTIEE
jgi:uncharacterized repeat protein (TIGR01451 family)